MRATIPAAIAMAAAAALADGRKEQSADVLNQAKADQRALAKANAAGVSAADVGDADSFGRNAHFLGVAQTGTVSFQVDCTPDPAFPPGPDDRCIVIVAAPGTTNVEARDIARIRFPAKAVNSLLCHSVTSFPFWHYNNTTASAANGLFQYGVGFTIDNDVLNDPALIDPTTGLPFGGSLEVPFGSLTIENPVLQPGDQSSQRHTDTRFCLAGIVSKSALTGIYGLTAAQADDFFKKPMTVHLNLSMRSRLVDDAQAFFGVRFFGD